MLSGDDGPGQAPRHPGRYVKEEVIEALGLSVTATADVLGVTRAALSALINERADLSPEMAIRIEKAFGVSMEVLMRMQSAVDIAEARKKAARIQVAPFPGGPAQNHAPFTELASQSPANRCANPRKPNA